MVSPCDHALIQGDFRACWLMVRFCFENGFIPIYAAALRDAMEEIQPGRFRQTDSSVFISSFQEIRRVKVSEMCGFVKSHHITSHIIIDIFKISELYSVLLLKRIRLFKVSVFGYNITLNCPFFIFLSVPFSFFIVKIHFHDMG
jgi:hypothetical protein